MILALSINVKKIDKARLFNGEKGTYLDAVVFVNDEPDQYGNYGMITQSVSKEERENGVKGEILGNCKIIGNGKSQGKPQGQPQATPEPSFSDDIPFMRIQNEYIY